MRIVRTLVRQLKRHEFTVITHVESGISLEIHKHVENVGTMVLKAPEDFKIERIYYHEQPEKKEPRQKTPETRTWYRPRSKGGTGLAE